MVALCAPLARDFPELESMRILLQEVASGRERGRPNSTSKSMCVSGCIEGFLCCPTAAVVSCFLSMQYSSGHRHHQAISIAFSASDTKYLSTLTTADCVCTFRSGLGGVAFSTSV